MWNHNINNCGFVHLSRTERSILLVKNMTNNKCQAESVSHYHTNVAVIFFLIWYWPVNFYFLPFFISWLSITKGLKVYLVQPREALACGISLGRVCPSPAACVCFSVGPLWTWVRRGLETHSENSDNSSQDRTAVNSSNWAVLFYYCRRPKHTSTCWPLVAAILWSALSALVHTSIFIVSHDSAPLHNFVNTTPIKGPQHLNPWVCEWTCAWVHVNGWQRCV